MMNKMKKSSICAVLIALSIVCGVTITAFAAPSISDLHNNEQLTTISATSTDGTNTARILSEDYIYTNEAISDQYKKKGENGKLVNTPLSDVIDLGAGTVTEIGENGHPIPDDIATVEEVVESYCTAANVNKPTEISVDLRNLDQITYWLDFKYESTDYRVVTGVEVDENGKKVNLDDGMIEVEIDGGEVIRSADIDDYLIIQIDAATGELHYLKMKDYNKETGKYVVDFPCIGPYMITQDMYY